MLVGIGPKWMKRTHDLKANLAPLYKRIIRSIPGTRITYEHNRATIIHFKALDEFLEEYYGLA